MLADNAMNLHNSHLVISPQTASPFLGRSGGRRRSSGSSTAACRILGGLGIITDDTIVPRSSATRARFASATVPPKCTAGRSPAAFCGPAEGHDVDE
jgi:hypothetical protein